MTGPARPLPWTLENVPHAALDILRGCNIRCRACSNTQPDHIKSMEEIESELDDLMRLRRLHSLSIVGGEVALHPQLPEVVRRVRRRGLFAELFSNGVALDGALLLRLKQAGANVIFLHIETGQERTDLRHGADAAAVRRLREEKTALVAAHGIETGLAVTVRPDEPHEIDSAVQFVLESPHAAYLLVTMRREVTVMPPLRGNLATGMCAGDAGRGWACGGADISCDEVQHRLREHYGIEAFGYVGSNADASAPRWLSFQIASAMQPDGKWIHRALRPTAVERTFLETTRRLTGRYPFWIPQDAARQTLHLFLNGLAGGGFRENMGLVRAATGRGRRLVTKRLLFQWPATLDAEGRLVHCRSCPDAVVRNGAMVPLCVCDRVMGESPCAETRAPEGKA